MQQLQVQVLKALSDQNDVVRKMLDDLKKLQETVVADLRCEVESLRAEVKTLQAQIPGRGMNQAVNTDLSCDQTVFFEMQERATHANNVMLYNIEECSSENKQTRIDYDLNRAVSVLGTLEVNVKPVMVIRVGKKQGDKPRPIKTVLGNSDTVKECFKNKARLSDYGIGIGPDLTITQRNHKNKIKRELNDRLNAGEKNIRIQYKQGILR